MTSGACLVSLRFFLFPHSSVSSLFLPFHLSSLSLLMVLVTLGVLIRLIYMTLPSAKVRFRFLLSIREEEEGKKGMQKMK